MSTMTAPASLAPSASAEAAAMRATSSSPAAVSFGQSYAQQVSAPLPPQAEHQAFQASENMHTTAEDVLRSGTMRISRVENGKPVYNWKSNNQTEPTTLQKYMGEDMFIGMAAGSVLTLALKMTGIIAVGFSSLPAVATVIGISLASAAIGGYFNKQRVEKQMEEGVDFEPPSAANRGLLHGLMQGIVAGGGMTIFTGGLIKPLAEQGGFEALSGAAQAMAPTLTAGVVGAAALSSFAIPLVAAAGMGLYMAYKRSHEHEEAAEKRYAQAQQIFEVQQGMKRAIAPVKELENNISTTINRDYTREGAIVAGTMVGAVALNTLAHTTLAHDDAATASKTISVLSKLKFEDHNPAHTIAELAHETSQHAQIHTSHAANAANTAKTTAESAAPTAAKAAQKSFVERYAANREENPALYTDRIAQQSDSPSLSRSV